MRMYDGCAGSELKAYLDAVNSAEDTLEALNPLAHCCYFPMEGQYSVWLDYKQITRDHGTRLDALNEAIQLLTK